jgi:hypothetical protein
MAKNCPRYTTSLRGLAPAQFELKKTNQYSPLLCPFYRSRPGPNSRLRKYSLTEKARTLLGGKVLSLPLTFRNHPFQSATALKPMNPTRLKTSQDVGMT